MGINGFVETLKHLDPLSGEKKRNKKRFISFYTGGLNTICRILVDGSGVYFLFAYNCMQCSINRGQSLLVQFMRWIIIRCRFTSLTTV